jgi:3D (Asp-Asp-Asp) domain-containing protein
MMQGLDMQRRVTRDFALEAMYQGSGYLDLGTAGDYNGYVSYNTQSGQTLETATFRRTACPETRTMSCAVELQTGAVSPKKNERQAMGIEIWGDNPQEGVGTTVYIENLGRQITVNDTGGDVGQKFQREHIDVYAGLRGKTSDLNFVDPPDSRVWRLERVE